MIRKKYNKIKQTSKENQKGDLHFTTLLLEYFTSLVQGITNNTSFDMVII